MKDSLEIGRLAVFQRGLELNFFRCANGRFVQTVAKTLHDALDADLPGGRKHGLEQNLTLNLKPASFISVNRAGLIGDLRGYGFYDRLGWLGFGLGSGSDVRVSEPSLAYRAARRRDSSGTIAGGNAAAEAGTGNDAPRTLRAAGTVAIAWAPRHIKAASLGNGNGTAVIFRRRHTVGVAEAAGLYLLRGGRHGWRGRAAGREDISLDQLLGNHRTRVGQSHRLVGREIHFGRLHLGCIGLLRCGEFGGNAQCLWPRGDHFRSFWRGEILDRSWLLGHGRRSVDQADEVIVVHR